MEFGRVGKINSLPDVLLCHILSFLPTKEAVATSILSKRWEFIWTEVPVLDFTFDSDSARNVKRFVERVLILNHTSALRFFRFDYIEDYDEEVSNDAHLYSWINNIMRRAVDDMVLRYDHASLIDMESLKTLPACIFVNQKLKTWTTPTSSPVHLPNLSKLRFHYIHFRDDFILKDFLIGLPRLEELQLDNCTGLQSCLDICSSSLKRLEIIDIVSYMRKTEKKIKIVAPSLKYLLIQDSFAYYEFEDTHLLEEVKLKLYNTPESFEFRMVDFLKL